MMELADVVESIEEDLSRQSSWRYLPAWVLGVVCSGGCRPSVLREMSMRIR
jgi:hypothetical protein